MTSSSIVLDQKQAVAWIWMNRPDLHNAFDETLIRELTEAIIALETDHTVRVIVLAGHGKSFSAGADLNWMKRQGASSQEQNIADAKHLARLFAVLSDCTKPTVARVQGAAMGGGMGLAAACDICLASDRAFFATSEVRLGLIPSVIGPYVIRAIGARQAFRYFQTGERIPAKIARDIGLVHEVVEDDGLDTAVAAITDALLSGGPQAQAAAKALIRDVENRSLTPQLHDDCAVRIAELRASPEAREGLTAFLEKRRPVWMESTSCSPSS
ncbi:enoyl-CoA hydratase/isomerase family protein [Jiella sp. MQZ9-1]|uniref:Enoyl-CoA hydratase/isomerase family protein n=1 Tax=Jiella flava TaxID=2816857 RepID=A0A939FW73_9HYPH|nr:enoyl-CoA hydratase/isomerase family protein [Jiella flava]MBO0661906.1 enoyl-CoA hydratase/isomerase family protein [Jiella flava]MCD2470766.1 enoyl-CoA hydratase/isomerase family protein [Jiella flava]